ncbi:MAG: hypothetical protein EON95_18315 [Caulobacteraceae bacterium]|nr:MAG: hypothetical protein EON95_18315 [Caulobacteraceae bacterium]
MAVAATGLGLAACDGVRACDPRSAAYRAFLQEKPDLPRPARVSLKDIGKYVRVTSLPLEGEGTISLRVDIRESDCKPMGVVAVK